MNKKDILNIFNNEKFIEVYLESEATTLSYERHFMKLVSLIPLEEGDRVLDVGTAHGPPSLELFKKQPLIEVVAIDPAENILSVAEAKFHGLNIQNLFDKYINNTAILTYLLDQYQQCSVYGDNISFVQGFAEDIDKMNLGNFDHVVGSLALHWLIDPVKTFSNFNQILKKEGTVSISSASWKYKMSNPRLKHEERFENSPFIKKFYCNLDELIGCGSEKIENVDFWDLEKVQGLLNKTGFKLVSYDEEKVPISLGHLIMSCKSGAFYRSQDRLKTIKSKSFLDVFREALLNTLNEIDPLESVNDYPEMCPYILAKKI